MAVSSAQLTPPAARPERPGPPPGPYLVAGLGEAGTAAVRALVRHAGPQSVRAWDASIEVDVRRSSRALTRLGVEVRLGGDGVDALEGIRTVVKSPGIRQDVAVLTAARARGLATMDELELGWRLTAAPVVAVTGTNGKSTTAALLVAVLSAAGRRPLLAGNTTFGSPLSAVDPDEAAGGCIVAEVSSFQAEASPRFMPEAAVFTNLTREHIHRHGSVAACGRAKRRLFVRGARVVPLAAVNSDDRFGRRLLAEVGELGGTAVGFGTSPAADYRVRSAATLGLDAATLELDTPSGAVTLRTRLPGEYNAMNVAGTLALADGLGVERDASLAALESAAPVPRRFERIDAGQSFEVIVDFAHNPDGVQRALALARELASKRGGRVIAVLGVVGRGDWHTREHVGRVARTGSDVLVLCASSVRGEPRLVTLGGMLAGARAVGGAEVEPVLERRAAIARALAQAAPRDVVVVMGRGTITRMAYDGRGGVGHFDDAEVTRELLEELA